MCVRVYIFIFKKSSAAVYKVNYDERNRDRETERNLFTY